VKRITAGVLFVLLGLVLIGPPAAHARIDSDQAKSQKKLQKEWQKSSKKQAKAHRKELKAQQKAIRKKTKEPKTTITTT
jgi:hypothetical protein